MTAARIAAAEHAISSAGARSLLIRRLQWVVGVFLTLAGLLGPTAASAQLPPISCPAGDTMYWLGTGAAPSNANYSLIALGTSAGPYTFPDATTITLTRQNSSSRLTVDMRPYGGRSMLEYYKLSDTARAAGPLKITDQRISTNRTASQIQVRVWDVDHGVGTERFIDQLVATGGATQSFQVANPAYVSGAGTNTVTGIAGMQCDGTASTVDPNCSVQATWSGVAADTAVTLTYRDARTSDTLRTAQQVAVNDVVLCVAGPRLSLTKAWHNNTPNGTSTSLTLSGGSYPTSAVSGSSTKGGTTTPATIGIKGGDVINLGESLTGYQKAYTCSAGTVNQATGEVTLPATVTGDVSCSITNTPLPTVRIGKISHGGTATFSYPATTNLSGAFDPITTTAAGGTVPSAYTNALPITSFGTDVTVQEAAVSGWLHVAASGVCRDANAATTGNIGSFGAVSSTGLLTIPSDKLLAGSDISCTFTNNKLATISLVKASTSQGTPVTFTQSGVPESATGSPNASTLSSFTLDPDGAGPTFTAAQSYVNVTPGVPITFSELATPNINQYSLVGMSCVPMGGTPTGSTVVYSAINGQAPTGTPIGSATVTLVPGANVTCTFTNIKNPKIILTKRVEGPDDSFSFSASSSAAGTAISPASPITLTTSGGTTSRELFVTGLTGANNTTSVTLNETVVPAGWTLSSLVCTNLANGTTLSPSTTPSASITNGQVVLGGVTVNSEIGCTYTNTKLPTIRIAKNSLHGTGTFHFGDGSNGLPSSLELTTASTANPAVSAPYTVMAMNTAASITEIVPAGWTLTAASCVDASNTVVASTRSGNTLIISPEALNVGGAELTCTFTNSKLATMAFNKAKKSNDTTSIATATISRPANSNLSAPVGATITSAATDGVPGAATPPVSVSASLTAVSITESPAPGYVLTGASCTDANAALSNNPAAPFDATVDSASGLVTIPANYIRSNAQLTCTLTNTKLGQINIVKSASPQGSTPFSFATTGAGLTNFELSDNGSPGGNSRLFTDLAVPGTYTVTEAVMPGWNTSVSCAGDRAGADTITSTTDGGTATINLDAGEVITCTYVNHQLPTLTVQKISVGGTGTFEFTGGDSPNGYPGESITTTTSSTAQAGATVTLASAGMATTIVESAYAGYQLTDASCSGMGAGGMATLDAETRTLTLNAEAAAAGSDIVCTFINTKAAKLTVRKISNGTMGTFQFTAEGGSVSPTSFDITTTASGVPQDR